MRIQFVEIQNFRKLQSVRIDFSEKTTLFVGANNSGKTSAMVALGHFLVDPNRFTTNDFTLSNWSLMNEVGLLWEKQVPGTGAEAEPAPTPTASDIESILPTVDIWLNVGAEEIHHVRHLVPTLDWAGGLLGVRLQLRPKVIAELQRDYLAAIKAAKETMLAGAKANGREGYALALWPQNLRDFLDRKLRTMFSVQAYLLDPKKRETPLNGVAKLQALPVGCEPLEGHPFTGLIKIDEIGAQRGLGDQNSNRMDADGKETSSSREQRKLSEQLRTYYINHLDPFDFPVPADLEALEAIEGAQKAFDIRLADSFADSLKELATLNYPGITDPKMKIATKLRPTDGLKHSAAVQYEVLPEDGKIVTASLRLPEEYNGLGYQNLISMVFKLMSFRDGWMRVGKADKSIDKENILAPLHLVLVEEPEAHLHAQVQQVFVRKAYEVLRNHGDLGKKTTLRTQLVVSTHSSHIVHETPYSSLRYFRRLPPGVEGSVPTSAVINLSEVFGTNDETERFVTRYLKATHCDLFFADAAILVEGPAERMLVPHFIKNQFKGLNRCFVTLLEIGGSHAHKLRKLIEHLGLITLIITDIDSVAATGKHLAEIPMRGKGLLTGNSTLKTWHPVKTLFDELLDHPHDQKVKVDPQIPMSFVRVAYQIPITVKMTASTDPIEALATTFEDSLVFENLPLFRALDGDGMIKKVKEVTESSTDAATLSGELFKIINKGDKALFALDLLGFEKRETLLDELVVPKYINEGLSWLENILVAKQVVVLPTVVEVMTEATQ